MAGNLLRNWCGSLFLLLDNDTMKMELIDIDDINEEALSYSPLLNDKAKES